MFDLDSTFNDLFGTSNVCEKCGKEMTELTCNCQPIEIKVDEKFEKRNALLAAFETDENDG